MPNSFEPTWIIMHCGECWSAVQHSRRNWENVPIRSPRRPIHSTSTASSRAAPHELKEATCDVQWTKESPMTQTSGLPVTGDDSHDKIKGGWKQKWHWKLSDNRKHKNYDAKLCEIRIYRCYTPDCQWPMRCMLAWGMPALAAEVAAPIWKECEV